MVRDIKNFSGILIFILEGIRVQVTKIIRFGDIENSISVSNVRALVWF